jgi:hypothetical protein
MKARDSLEIEEVLNDLDHKLNRLRIEYDQYFMGSGKREPQHLKADVQREITRFMSEPPRNAALKFRLNSIVARYQAFRAMWGRTQREIEAGTYKRHRFKAKLHDLEAAENGITNPGTSQPGKVGRAQSSAMDRLCDALESAREKTGQGGVDRAAIQKAIRKQTAELKRKHPDKKVKFRVVVEGNKAKLKASVK